MKTINILIIACTAAVLFASCTKEVLNSISVTSDLKDFVIEATQEGLDTKTAIDSQTGRILWSAGDEISVFFGEAGAKYVSANEEMSESAAFVYSNDVLVGGIEGQQANGGFIYGMHPFDAQARCEDGIITTTLPDVQAAAAGTFDDNLFISIGRTAKDNPCMGFYNVCGGLRFKVDEQGITSATFSGKNGEVVAGKFKVGFDANGMPTAPEIVDGKTSITVNCPEGFETGVWYYIVTLPVKIDDGYTMTFASSEKEDQIKVFEYNSPYWGSLEIKRSVFGSKDFLVSDLNWVREGNIVFEDASFKAYCVDNFDKDGDSEVSYLEGMEITSLKVSPCDVSSLAGIEYFPNLMSLYCAFEYSYSSYDDNYQLHYYDSSDNEIICKLKEIDISNNTLLEELYCSNCDITSLDVSKNTRMTKLYCPSCNLTSLDLSNNLELTTLECSYQPIKVLDVSASQKLQRLYCYSNDMAVLYIGCDQVFVDFWYDSINTSLMHRGGGSESENIGFLNMNY